MIDHALTRPWSVDKTFRRNPNPHPSWARTPCIEGTHQIVIGNENYFLSGDALLMPTRRIQAVANETIARQLVNIDPLPQLPRWIYCMLSAVPTLIGSTCVLLWLIQCPDSIETRSTT